MTKKTITTLPLTQKKQTYRFANDIFPQGTANFPALVTPSDMSPDKLSVVLKMPKGMGINDEFAHTTNDLHKSLGGEGDGPVKDGDIHKPEYNAGHWVVTFKCSTKYPLKGYDQFGKDMDLDEIAYGDEVRVRPSLYDYSDSKAQGKGVATYFTEIQLVDKGQGTGGMPAVQGYEDGPEEGMPAATGGNTALNDVMAKLKSRQAAQKQED